MRRPWCKSSLLFILMTVALLPREAFAQSVIAGVVRDTTGAVLPGVTVEASSPALIEKVRVATTDNAGAYRVIDLRPGVYSVRFTLPGFNTFIREQLELTADFTSADLGHGVWAESSQCQHEHARTANQAASHGELVEGGDSGRIAAVARVPARCMNHGGRHENTESGTTCHRHGGGGGARMDHAS